MKPKLNKLITLLLLLGTFAFLMEAEERVSAVAQKELSKWASLLPVKIEKKEIEAPSVSKNVLVSKAEHSEASKKVNSVNN